MAEDIIEKIDDTNFKIITSGTSVAKSFSITTLLNQKHLIETRIQAIDAHAISDKAALNTRLQDVEDLIHRAIDAGIVISGSI